MVDVKCNLYLKVPWTVGYANSFLSATKYLYYSYMSAFDWFLKANDNSFVVMENLRHLLSTSNLEIPRHLGHKPKSPKFQPAAESI